MSGDIEDIDLTKISEDELKRLSIKPDLWAEKFITIKGQKFDLSGREYLRPIYREFSPVNRNRTVMLKCGRKVEKTTLILNLILYCNVMIPYFKTLYTTYRQEQVSAFVFERFADALLSCRYPGFRDMVSKDSASHKIFRIDEKVNTHFFAHSAWGNAVGLLGLDLDFAFCDEIQDFEPGWFEKVNETLSQSKYKFLLISGTARDTGSEFHKFWLKSTQKEWNRDLHIWEAKNPDGIIEGYHISQEMCPGTNNPDDLKKKRELYTPRKYYNEVLGEFYSGATKPLTEEVIRWNLVQDVGSDFLTEAPNKIGLDDDGKPKEELVETVMGVDFGNYTYVTVQDFNMNVLTSFNFDSRKEDEREVLSRTIERFNVRMMIGDYGHGARQIRELQAEYGDRVRSCMYQKRPANPLDYKRKDKNHNPIYMYIADRTTYMDKVIDNFYKQSYKIPYGRDRMGLPTRAKVYVDKTLIPELISIRTDLEDEDEETTKSGTWSSDYTKYGHEGHDHSFHTFVYCEIAISNKRAAPFAIDIKL